MKVILSDNYSQMTAAELSGEIDQTEDVLASFELPRNEMLTSFLGRVSIWDGEKFIIERAGIVDMRFVPSEDKPVRQVYKSWPVPSEVWSILSAMPLEVARIKPIANSPTSEVDIVSTVTSSYTKDYSRHRERTVRVSPEEIRRAGHRFLISPKGSQEA